MTTTLLAGAAHPVTDDLIRAALDAGKQVVVAADDVGAPGQSEERLIRVPWTPRSAISAKAALTHARNAFSSVDEFIIVFAPEKLTEGLPEFSISQVESYLDTWLRAYIYLCREALQYLSEQKAGELVIVTVDEADSVHAPLEAGVRGAVYGMAETLVAQYRSGNPAVYAYHGEITPEQVSEFVSFACGERTYKDRGRVHRFGRRGTLRSLFK